VKALNILEERQKTARKKYQKKEEQRNQEVLSGKH
jgi:hypothetical protein